MPCRGSGDNAPPSTVNIIPERVGIAGVREGEVCISSHSERDRERERERGMQGTFHSRMMDVEELLFLTFLRLMVMFPEPCFPRFAMFLKGRSEERVRTVRFQGEAKFAKGRIWRCGDCERRSLVPCKVKRFSGSLGRKSIRVCLLILIACHHDSHNSYVCRFHWRRSLAPNKHIETHRKGNQLSIQAVIILATTLAHPTETSQQ